MSNKELGKNWSSRISEILDALNKEDYVKHLKEFHASLVKLKEEAKNLPEENRKEGYSDKFEKILRSLKDYEDTYKD